MLINSTTPRIVHLNIDFVISAMEARPATRTRAKAWGWLAEQSAATFAGDAVIVQSATWDKTSYLATAETCTCPARGHCWHKEAAAMVIAAIAADAAENAHYDAMAERDALVLPFDLGADLADYPPAPIVDRAAAKAKAYADVMELFA